MNELTAEPKPRRRIVRECVCLHVRRDGTPCGKVWYPKQPGRPAQCPKCHSVRWDKLTRPARVEPETETKGENR